MIRKKPVFAVCVFSFLFLLIISHGSNSMEAAVAFKSHPTLVNLEASNCTTCHDDITSKKFVHSAIKDSGCDSCHEMKKEKGKTLVALTEKRSQLCYTCHSEIEERSKKKYAHPTLGEWCEVCHKSHSSDNPKLLQGNMDKLCSSCHQIREEDFKKKHGRQPVAKLGCAGCHNPHGSDQKKMFIGKKQHVPFAQGECEACHKRPRGIQIRLRGVGAKLCYACHGDKEKEFKKASVHTPVKKGECTGCHDAHLAKEDFILKNKGNALCFDCHKGIEKLMKSANIHPPAEESCDNCHLPHASGNDFQLKQALVPLCLDCHDTSEQAFKTKHFNRAAKDLHCSECHNPHGSPNKKLINSHAHPPFLENQCDSCHVEGKVELADKDINALCINCHDDKADGEANKGLFKHGVLESGDCTACHSGHASSRKYILKNHTSKLCTTCHDDKAHNVEGKPFVHPVIEGIGCEACHESHYSKSEKLLLEKPNKLCTACHVKQKSRSSREVIKLFGKIDIDRSELDGYKKIILSSDRTRGHPQRGHIVAGNVTPESMKKKRRRGLTFSGEMTCLSCHDAHNGAAPWLFADGKVNRFRLCMVCHQK